MTDWIEHTGDTCPVDPETVVEVKLRDGYIRPADKAGDMDWGSFWLVPVPHPPPLPSTKSSSRITSPPHPLDVTHYRIITPVKPPEPEMVAPGWVEVDMGDGRTARYRVTAVGPNGPVPVIDDAPEVTFKSDLFKDPDPEMPEPDLIALRLECLKLALQEVSEIPVAKKIADDLLHYVLNGSVDKA